VEGRGEADAGRLVSPLRERQVPGQGGADTDRRRPSAQVREFLKGKFDRELTS
jgi:hypothetical protein